jgi:hypothetical protein
VNGGAIFMAVIIVVIVGVTAYLVGTLARSIQREKSTQMKMWKNFGLSLGFCALFFITWVAQGVAQWQRYTDDQREHHEPVELGDFVADFSQSTLENWQSEFLQLFWQVLGLTYFLYVGSPQSKEEDDRFEDKLDAVLRKLDPQGADALIQQLDQRYPGRYVGPKM